MDSEALSDGWPFVVFLAFSICFSVWVPRLWTLDLDALKQRFAHTPAPFAGLGRRSVAASPAALVTCWVVSAAGVLVVFDDWALPLALRLSLGVVVFGSAVVTVAAVYVGHPRLALLPAVRDREAYEAFVTGTA